MTPKSRLLPERKPAAPLRFVLVPILVLSVVQWRLHNSASFRRLSSQHDDSSSAYPYEEVPLYHHCQVTSSITNSNHKPVSRASSQGSHEIDPREARGFRSIHRTQEPRRKKDFEYQKFSIHNNRNTNSSNNTFSFGASHANSPISSSRPTTPLQKSFPYGNGNNIAGRKNKSKGTANLTEQTFFLPKQFQVESAQNSTTVATTTRRTNTSSSSTMITTGDAVMIPAHHYQTKQTTSRHTQDFKH